MKRSSFIPVDVFCDKFSLSYNYLSTIKVINNISDSVFKKNGSKNIYVDENYFLRRVAFKNKIQQSIECFYFVMRRHLNDNEIAYALSLADEKTSKSSWNTFVSRSLFAYTEEKITNTKITRQKWNFFKIMRGFFIRAFHKIGRKFSDNDLNVLLYRDDLKKAIGIKHFNNNAIESKRVSKLLKVAV